MVSLGVRNKFVFEKKLVTSGGVLDYANCALLSWPAADSLHPKLSRVPTVDKHLIPPRTGCLKWNIVTVTNRVNSAGDRVMIRDCLGAVVIFAASSFWMVVSKSHAELLGMRVGLLLAQTKGLLTPYVECTSLNIISVVNLRFFDFTKGVLIMNIVYLIS
ncbi:hypothetical protein TorRG33x02_010860 [Trema orientale]|uniref:RNase H type-1 domain-containing protein n=1 Tax=Trema orientale TaxID=63057 RepID=A0A2P5FZ12_TREOI|nr:hypothetical protein TorRG33x02_010860 [Trema orientale]